MVRIRLVIILAVMLCLGIHARQRSGRSRRRDDGIRRHVPFNVAILSKSQKSSGILRALLRRNELPSWQQALQPPTLSPMVMQGLQKEPPTVPPLVPPGPPQAPQGFSQAPQGPSPAPGGPSLAPGGPPQVPKGSSQAPGGHPQAPPEPPLPMSFQYNEDPCTEDVCVAVCDQHYDADGGLCYNDDWCVCYY